MDSFKKDIIFSSELKIELSFLNAEDSQSFGLNNSFYLKQVHSDLVHDWSPGDKSALIEADAMVIDLCKDFSNQNSFLIKTADCAPIVFADLENKKVVMVHAGWKGVLKGIHDLVFRRGLMSPSLTSVYLGPCLNKPFFEMSEDVCKRFVDKNESFRQFFSEQENKKYNFDVWDYMNDLYVNHYKVKSFFHLKHNTFDSKSFASYRRFKNNGSQGQLQHNYCVLKVL